MQTKWSKIFLLTALQTRQSNWDLFFKSIQRRPQWQQIILTKYNARILPTGTNLKRRGHADTTVCPGCGHEETSDHLFRCPGNQASLVYEEHMAQLQKHLDMAPRDTPSHQIHRLITAMRHGTLADLTVNEDDFIRLQAALGHRALTAGLWHNIWTCLPQQQDNEIHKRQQDSWMLAFITKIQNLILELWYHRNEIMHKTDTNSTTAALHLALNIRIDDVFRRKPHNRLLTHAEVIYFTRRTPQTLKKLRLQRKKAWVSGAELIIEQRLTHMDNRATKFVQYFQWDTG
jgi:hypothetical protein